MNLIELMDSSQIINMVFYPRRAAPNTSRVKGAIDGTIPVKDDIALGYRLYPAPDSKAVLLYFHGNGEIASDYDDIAPMAHKIGASLLVVDFRGYGWSTGRPLVSALLSDVEAVHKGLPEVLRQTNLNGKPLYVMGRSLGSIPAIEMATRYPESFKGIIIESGFSEVLPWLSMMGLPVHLLNGLDPIGNRQKMSKLELPLLVIHGERDNLLPVIHGQSLYDASPAKQKEILRVPRAGHNDLLFYAADPYFAAIRRLIDATAG